MVELEERGSCDREFGSNTVAWLAQVTGGDRRAVAARVKTGVKLRRFDAVDGARNRLTLSSTGDRVIVRGEFVGELALGVAHHLETAPDLALLCRHHHGVTHPATDRRPRRVD